MITNLPLLRQFPGSNSCLSTAVRSILLWHGERTTAEEVSEWCGEEPEGCVLDLAIDGLRNAGFEVEELRADTDEEAQELLRTTITDEDDPQPVIVILQNPLLATRLNHAVVVIHVEPDRVTLDAQWSVEFMDPLTGRIERDTSGMFWRQWDFAGQRAFVIRP